MPAIPLSKPILLVVVETDGFSTRAADVAGDPKRPASPQLCYVPEAVGTPPGPGDPAGYH